MKQGRIFLVILFSWLSLQLYGQAQLSGVLSVDSVQGYCVQLTLQIGNTGDAAFEYTFGSSEQAYFSVDGIPAHSASLPVVLPYYLAPGDMDEFTLESTRPLCAGQHEFQAYLSVLDNEGNELPMGEPVEVVIEASQTITIGTGSATSRIPIDFYWRSTLYECIYTAAELNFTSGYVSSLTIYPAFRQLSMPYQDIKVFLGNTTLDDLSNGWIPAGELTPVYDGLLSYWVNQDTLEIPLQEGFYYNGHDNLVLMAFRPIPSSYAITADPCYADPADLFRSRKACTDSYYYDPYNPPTASPAQHIAHLPKFSVNLIPYASSAVEDENNSPALSYISHYPNPVKEGCTFVLDKACPAKGNLTIYNLKGQVVNSFAISNISSHFWDGKDRKGIFCPSGVYLYKYDSAVNVKPGKLLIIR